MTDSILGRRHRFSLMRPSCTPATTYHECKPKGSEHANAMPLRSPTIVTRWPATVASAVAAVCSACCWSGLLSRPRSLTGSLVGKFGTFVAWIIAWSGKSSAKPSANDAAWCLHDLLGICAESIPADCLNTAGGEEGGGAILWQTEETRNQRRTGRDIDIQSGERRCQRLTCWQRRSQSSSQCWQTSLSAAWCCTRIYMNEISCALDTNSFRTPARKSWRQPLLRSAIWEVYAAHAIAPCGHLYNVRVHVYMYAEDLY